MLKAGTEISWGPLMSEPEESLYADLRLTGGGAWNKLHGHADFERILEDLKKSHRVNQKTWRRLLDVTERSRIT